MKVHDWSKYYAIKKECQFECRAAYNKYFHDLIDPNSDIITKRLWAYIKSKKQDQTGIGALNYQGNTYTDSKDKANLFADYFHLYSLMKTPLTLLNWMELPCLAFLHYKFMLMVYIIFYKR